MKISQISSAKRYGTIPNILASAIGLLAFIGFLDSSYLTAKRFLGEPLTCYLFGGCDTVTASSYSVLFGIPLSIYGIVFYLAVLFSAMLYIQTKSPWFAYGLLGLTTAGFVLSGYFMLLQAFVIKAYCFYCVVSAAVSTFNFILMFFAWNRYFKKLPEEGDPTFAAPE